MQVCQQLNGENVPALICVVQNAVVKCVVWPWWAGNLKTSDVIDGSLSSCTSTPLLSKHELHNTNSGRAVAEVKLYNLHTFKVWGPFSVIQEKNRIPSTSSANIWIPWQPFINYKNFTANWRGQTITLPKNLENTIVDKGASVSRHISDIPSFCGCSSLAQNLQ